MVSTFLKERKDRFEPNEANSSGLKRVKKIDFSGTVHLEDEVSTRTKMILVKHGDLLISGINAEKGAVSVYTEREDALATIHYSSYKYDSNKINIEYLKYLLMSPVFKRILKEHSKSGIKTELKPKKFLSLELPLPDIKDQKTCVNYLHRLINKIDLLNNQVASNGEVVKKLRQAILQEAVQGKLVEQKQNKESATELLKKIKAEKERLIKEKKIKKENPLPPIRDDEMPYKLPKGWACCRLGELLKESPRNGYSPKAVNYQTEIKSLTLSATTKGFFDDTCFKYLDVDIGSDSHLWLKKNDILVQRSNSPEYVGVSAVYTSADDQFVYPDLMMKLKLFKDLIDVKYINYWLSSLYVRRYYIKKSTGTSSSMRKINQGTVSKTLVVLPPLREQKRIVGKVDKLMKYCDELEAKINQSKADSEKLRQAVLQEAFN